MSNRKSEKVFRLAMWVPPVILIGLLIAGGARERWATAQYRERVAEMAKSGLPVTTTALFDKYNANFSPDHAMRWKQLLDAASHVQAMNRDSVAEMEELVPETEVWPAEPFAKAISEQAKPVLRRLNELLESDEPVWQSIHFRNQYWSTGYELNSLRWLLENEFRLAVHAGDSDRAFEILEVVAEITTRIDSHDEMIRWTRSPLADELAESIRQSVALPFWSEKNLEQLLRLIPSMSGAVDAKSVNENWLMQFVASEPLSDRGHWIHLEDNYTRDVMPFGASGVHALAALNFLETSVRTNETSRENANGRRSVALEESEARDELIDRSRSLVAVPYATLNREIRSEWNMPSRWYRDRGSVYRDDQRWTSTAIYLRKYQVANGEFPMRLESLQSVGASPEDWILSTGEQLGYRVDNDGSSAVLWTDDHISQPNEPIGVGGIPYSERQWGSGRADLPELWFDRSLNAE